MNDVYQRTDILDRNVPFAFRQARLLSAFRVSSGGCAIRNIDPVHNPDGGNAPAAPAAPPAPPAVIPVDERGPVAVRSAQRRKTTEAMTVCAS